ncbi:MAG: outer membrane lipoprotein carrier protein LolA [Proteobacteria bacterium]|nr:outer membrane lipoprotein carrier protein LolA [Pseudomonadota bacterium]MBU1710385.1 outer membrane lipoprotein carrier protein LolA [Pseudomonadota bacterium]
MAQIPGPLEIAGSLQKAYEKTRSISADFDQKTTVTMTGRDRHGAGKLVILKPGQMRWDYLTPDKQVIICDGETITMYFEKNRQLIAGSAREYISSDVTYSFFTGTGDIIRDFEVSAPDEDILTLESSHGIDQKILPADDTYVIKLIPRKPHPQVDYIHAWVQKDSFLISRLQIVDLFGSITDLTFTHIKTNIPVDAGYFNFAPPPDTEIIVN